MINSRILLEMNVRCNDCSFTAWSLFASNVTNNTCMYFYFTFCTIGWNEVHCPSFMSVNPCTDWRVQLLQHDFSVIAVLLLWLRQTFETIFPVFDCSWEISQALHTLQLKSWEKSTKLCLKWCYRNRPSWCLGPQGRFSMALLQLY